MENNKNQFTAEEFHMISDGVLALIENTNKALIYFNRAWALDASDKDCEKAINLIMSKNKKAL